MPTDYLLVKSCGTFIYKAMSLLFEIVHSICLYQGVSSRTNRNEPVHLRVRGKFCFIGWSHFPSLLSNPPLYTCVYNLSPYVKPSLLLHHLRSVLKQGETGVSASQTWFFLPFCWGNSEGSSETPRCPMQSPWEPFHEHTLDACSISFSLTLLWPFAQPLRTIFQISSCNQCLVWICWQVVEDNTLVGGKNGCNYPLTSLPLPTWLCNFSGQKGRLFLQLTDFSMTLWVALLLEMQFKKVLQVLSQDLNDNSILLPTLMGLSLCYEGYAVSKIMNKRVGWSKSFQSIEVESLAEISRTNIQMTDCWTSPSQHG